MKGSVYHEDVEMEGFMHEFIKVGKDGVIVYRGGESLKGVEGGVELCIRGSDSHRFRLLAGQNFRV